MSDLQRKTSEQFSRFKGVILRRLISISRFPIKNKHYLEMGPLTYSHTYQTSDDSTDEIMSKEECYSPSSTSNITPAEHIEMVLIKVTRRKKVSFLFIIDKGVIKWKDTKQLEVNKIKDVRTGQMAMNYREEYNIPESFANRWITIIYQEAQHKFKALHLIAPTPDDMRIFYVSLVIIFRKRRQLMESISIPSNEQFANMHWHLNVSTKKSDENKDSLTFQDVKNLCNKFHIFYSTPYLEELFERADENGNHLLNFREFQTFVQLLKERHEIRDIWNSIANNTKVINFENFYKFLINVQGEEITKNAAQRLFANYSEDGLMNENMLLKYLTSQDYLKASDEDYSRPLSQYFISSSHNTYILGNQVGGMTSVEGYIKVLQQGCRSVEIDIWDSEDGPVVCHGRFTASIPLRNVVEVIRKYAFFSSPYPLIISLEIHCCSEGQLIIEQVFQELLGPLLFITDPHLTLPSPRELKHKIILKSKKVLKVDQPSPCSSGQSTSSKGSSCESDIEAPTSITSDTTKNKSKPKIKLKKKRVPVSESLLRISSIHGIRFKNFSHPESKPPIHCFSLNERKFRSLRKGEKQRYSIDKHNRSYLMRVYPHLLRYNSSNFNPIKCWKAGVQMVATNWQTYDLGQQINEAMFRISNEKDHLCHSGYVRKPWYLLDPVQTDINIKKIFSAVLKSKLDFSFELISAQLLTRPKNTPISHDISFAPYVVIDILGNSIIEAPTVTNGVINSWKQVSTQQCKDKGCNPIWRTKIGVKLHCTGFNFIRFTVKNGDINLATSCIRLDYLKMGYRHIPLYNMEGERYIFSTLLICTKFG
ncbi:HCR015Cp [Eremothecium sinecaudum]|uniref:Phosphoinositide phospholipase C n=1 Tax=Eremothecium sinecaudum TaxID=45286 RepID=A0A0X8HRL3_9SACH|nr:HCR015Cp [Eremothecium sinecaudum]AMD20165.1 HCR015Cp [Eremothecium sinecaudum]